MLICVTITLLFRKTAEVLRCGDLILVSDGTIIEADIPLSRVNLMGKNV